MSAPFNPILTGTFTSDGTSQLITLPSDIVKFEVFDITYFGSTAGSSTEEIAWWVRGLSDGSAYVGNKTAGAATIAITSMTTTNGFTFRDPTVSEVGVATAITSTTNADPIVVATASTAGLNNGDTVRIYGVTGAQQISGIDWTIGNLIANTSFELIYTGVAPGSAGTAGFWRRVNIQAPFYPRRRFITFISQATSAVIEMSVTHGFTVGQLVRIIVPTGWGMTQINGQTGTITAISTANNTITVNIDTTSYTAFSYPTSAVALAGVTQAQVVPVGEAAVNSTSQPYGNLLDDATRNTSAYQMFLGSSVVGASSDVMRWIAYRGLSI